MVKYLIDSDILIDHLKGKPAAVGLMNKIGGFSEAAISAVTMAEIIEGALDFPEKLEQARILFEAITVLPVDKEIAKTFAVLRKQLRDEHQLIDNMDLFLAAAAIYHRLVLVTGNKKHFARIKKLKCLSPVKYVPLAKVRLIAGKKLGKKYQLK